VEQSKPKLAVGNRFDQKFERSPAADIQIKAVHQQKRVSRSKSHPPVAIHKSVIHDQRLHQSRRFLALVVVVTRLGTKNSRLQRAPIAQTVRAAVLLNLMMMDGDDFATVR
jgi:hypothetical protein